MIIPQDIYIAKVNWQKWIGVFEHQGAVEQNPLLTSSEIFKKFLGEYNVHRTIRAGTSDKFRRVLSSVEIGLAGRLNDSPERCVDELENLLRRDFGTMNGERGMKSVISKIAAFLAPEKFIAWDRFARKGVILFMQDRRLSHAYSTYADYLADVNFLLNEEMQDALIAACQGKYPTQYSSENNRFQRRVLDVYLMRIGGRWKKDVA